jgi:exopolysaccharide biosynthesis polyprenyl glycosylphosphotransferase
VGTRSANAFGHVVGLDALFAFAMALASAVYGNSARMPAGGVHEFLEMRITVVNAAFAALFMVAWAHCFGALARPKAYSIARRLLWIVKGCTATTVLLILYLYVIHSRGPTIRIAIIFFLSAICYKLCRLLFGLYVSARDPRIVIILGSGRRAGKAWREIRTQYHSTVKLLGFVDDRAITEMSPDIANRYLGKISCLNQLLLRSVVDELLIAVPMKSCYDLAQQAIAIAEEVGVRVVCLQDVYSSALRDSVHRDQELFGEAVPFHEDYIARQAVKRVVDVVGAFVGLCLLSPIFLLLAITIKMTSAGPIFFAQERYGYRRRIFRMYKFRSMVKDAPALMAQLESRNEAKGPIFKIRFDPRVTRLGAILRATSLDELPQLWNVLCGDMSLVGPRPMSIRDVSLFSEATSMRRFTVKPGITGLWQVSGRSALSFEQWLKLDFQYIDGWSLALDFHILARTVKAVVKRTGAV